MNLRVPALQLAIIAAACSWSCVKIDKFEFRDAGGGSGDDAGDGGTGSGSAATAYEQPTNHFYVVVPDLYRLDFADTGYRFPDSLLIGGEQLLAPKQTACAREHGVGVTYSPAAIFSSVNDPGLSQPTQNIRIELPGPGVAKVSLDWAGTFATGCSGSPYGRTTFSFFPDGRIQRMDVANLDTLVTASDCDCTTGANWEVATYYTFDEGMVNGLMGVVRPGAGMIGSSQSAGDTICFNGPGQAPFQLAMGWRGQVGGKRMRRITSGSLAAIADMIPGGTSPTLSAGMPIADTSTTMLIAKGTDCPTLSARALPFTADPQLAITHRGTTVDPIGLGQDGLYGGEHSGNQGSRGYDIGPISPVTLRAGTTLGAFAVRLDFVAMPNITRVTRNPPAADPGNWYTQQAVLDSEGNPTREYVFWFPDGLAGTDEIIIEAQP